MDPNRAIVIGPTHFRTDGGLPACKHGMLGGHLGTLAETTCPDCLQLIDQWGMAGGTRPGPDAVGEDMLLDHKTTPPPLPPVKGVDWSGVSCHLERADGEPVRIGEKIRGYTVTGGRPPHKEGSSGRVWVKNEEGGTGEFFPHVFGFRWVRYDGDSHAER